LPSRLNIAFGGCSQCREYAKFNDFGFVSVVAGDQPATNCGWGQPGQVRADARREGVRLRAALRRSRRVDALVDVYVEHHDFDRPNARG
jgi:hypothetical protein